MDRLGGSLPVMTTNGAAIAVESVSKRFAARGQPAGIVALENIDLLIQPKEFVALLGPSGCGKSTLLNIIAGFIPPTSGRVLHMGAPVVRPSRDRTVVFQDYALFPWMTLQQNVEFGLKAQGVSPLERAATARGQLARVDLAGFEDRYPHEISGGMKQRAAIARALVLNPSVLLMDEPFGALDAQTRVLLQEQVARLSGETGSTIVFVTHSIEEAIFLADRVIVMSPRPGRIRLELKVELPRPRLPEMRKDAWFVSTGHELWQSLKSDWQETKEAGS